jgi:hypothetical protein
VVGVLPFHFMSEVFSQSDLDEVEKEVIASIPAEKARAEIAAAQIAKKLTAEGPQQLQRGVGQKIGEIDGRTYMRWQNEYPGCWDNAEFVRAFFQDNPQYRAPGWKPRTDMLRHGKTFIGGKPV